VKAKALNAAYHGTFEDFKRAIDDCISIPNWGTALNQFAVFFGERVPLL
jgi:hypothetical protein